MPVESEQAQAPRPVAAPPPVCEPPEPAGDAKPEPPVAGEGRPEPRVAAPRPSHDDHELPDGRYLIAYRSAHDA